MRHRFQRWVQFGGFSCMVCAISLLMSGWIGTAMAQPAKPAPLKDALGHTVALPAYPTRIVSLAPNNTEILFALGLGEHIVGVTSYCDYPPAAKQKTVIGTYNEPSLEKIVSVKPDLVLAAHGNPVEVVSELEKLRISVFSVNPKTLSDVLQDIRTIGLLTGRARQGEALAASITTRIAEISGRTKSLPASQRPRVLFMGGWEPPYFTPGPGTVVNDLIELAGGRNVASDAQKQTWVQYSLETLIAKAPDVIVATYVAGENPKTRRMERVRLLKNMDGWRTMPAVRQDRLCYVFGDAIFRMGPRLVDALDELARCLHPGMFR